MMIRGAALAVLACLVAAPPASGDPKTDVIVLKNGDRITGEFKSMTLGRVELSTDDMSTIYIEWDKVASVTLTQQFEVAFNDGRRIVGVPRLEPGGALTVTSEGGVVVTESAGDVVTIDRIKKGFFQQIDGSLDVGASYTKSSGVAQVSFGVDATYRRPAFAAYTSFSTNVTESPDSPVSSRYSLNLGYTRYRSNRWFVNSFGLFEGNKDLGFDLRATAAVVAGRFLKQSSRAALALGGGISLGRELPVDDSPVTNVDAVVSVNGRFVTYDHPKTDTGFSLLLFPSLDQPGRLRVNANGRLKYEIFTDFFFGINGYDTFDSHPQTAGAAKNDVGFSLSIGWTF